MARIHPSFIFFLFYLFIDFMLYGLENSLKVYCWNKCINFFFYSIIDLKTFFLILSQKAKSDLRGNCTRETTKPILTRSGKKLKKKNLFKLLTLVFSLFHSCLASFDSNLQLLIYEILRFGAFSIWKSVNTSI